MVVLPNKEEPGAADPITPVPVPKLGVVPNPEFPKVFVVPNNPGLALAADVPPNKDGVWPNPRVEGVDVAVPNVVPTTGFVPNADWPEVNNPVPVLAR